MVKTKALLLLELQLSQKPLRDHLEIMSCGALRWIEEVIREDGH